MNDEDFEAMLSAAWQDAVDNNTGSLSAAPPTVYTYVPGRRSPVAVVTDTLDEVVYRLGTAARVLVTGRV